MNGHAHSNGVASTEATDPKETTPAALTPAELQSIDEETLHSGAEGYVRGCHVCS